MPSYELTIDNEPGGHLYLEKKPSKGEILGFFHRGKNIEVVIVSTGQLKLEMRIVNQPGQHAFPPEKYIYCRGKKEKERWIDENKEWFDENQKMMHRKI